MNKKRKLNEDSFEKLGQIGKGTYGDVYLAKIKGTSDLVALKKIKLHHETEGFPMTALREIKILFSTKHHNIIELIDIVTQKSAPDTLEDVFLVFEYCDADLVGLLSSLKSEKQWLTEEQICYYFQQILQGLVFLHSNNIMHRDLKASNILINKKHQIKIADFGLSIVKKAARKFTNRVITLWYRPPELLLGTDDYSYSVDMWSLGCILLEVLTGKSPFTAKDELSLLHDIFTARGAPNPEELKYYKTLPLTPKFNFSRYLTQYGLSYWRERAKRYIGETAIIPDLAYDLIEKLLKYNPHDRLTAQQALEHEWFQTELSLDKLPALNLAEHGSHEFQVKSIRKDRI